MRILVSAASKYGATAEIAARIAAGVRVGLPDDAVVDVLPSADVADVTAYDAVVIGSAVYFGRWLEDARDAVTRIAEQPPRPVWLFSSGPVGDPLKPADQSVDVADLIARTSARDHVVFAGSLDKHVLGFADKAMVLALRVPDGDYRDWAAIEAWGTRIAAELCQPVGIDAS